jgi:hypothetical protein
MTENMSETCEMCDVKLAEEAQRVADFAILFEKSKLEERRLTTENADLKRKLELELTDKLTRLTAELAIAGVDRLVEIRRLKHKCNSLWKVINASTPEHYPAKEDLTWEVIE